MVNSKPLKRKKLAGAELWLKNGEMISTLPDSYAPSAKETIEMPLDSEVNVITANNEQGIGTWLYRFGSDETSGGRSVQLNVPGSSVKYAKNIKLPNMEFKRCTLRKPKNFITRRT